MDEAESKKIDKMTRCSTCYEDKATGESFSLCGKIVPFLNSTVKENMKKKVPDL